MGKLSEVPSMISACSEIHSSSDKGPGCFVKGRGSSDVATSQKTWAGIPLQGFPVLELRSRSVRGSQGVGASCGTVQSY